MGKQLLLRFIRCERGVTAIEYGLIAAIVVIGIIASLLLLGGGVLGLYTGVNDGFESVR